ncbi:ArnT family glycosyltransferase [Verrucomicrobium spinosum]|uniref:ArnT family glycosyltransferase n=2 Tax=Verrucomicrobium spinosum TaxID=2736 RepID=UPI0012F667D6|nr:hypothetical protein [Verrucomicrobium spinosum]
MSHPGPEPVSSLQTFPEPTIGRGWGVWAMTWAALFCMALGLQWRGGAQGSDLGGDPDEAAHAVTSLMVRDYLFQAPGQHPLRFAEKYYDRLPRVALGHYPPGFYGLAGLWLGFKPTQGALLMLQAVLLAALGTATARVGAKLVVPWVAVGAGLLVILAPPIQQLVLLVMSDLFLALACLVATWAMAAYLERPSKRLALGFGFVAALAILIKGSGLMLALVPPLAIAISGQWRLVLRPSLWLAPLPVVVFAMPWQLFSYKFTKEGMSGLPVTEHFRRAFGYYGDAASHYLGYPVLVLLGLAALVMVIGWVRGRRPSAYESALWALLFAAWVLIFTVPAGMSARYLVPLVAPVFLLLAHSLCVWSRAAAGRPVWIGGVIGLGVLLTSLVTTGQWMPRDKNVHGYSAAVNAMVATLPAQPDVANDAWLVCSDARGEGALIAAAAFDAQVRQRPSLRVLRSTKELASMDWLGRDYTPAFDTETALLEHLTKKSVSYVVIDEGVPEAGRMPYYAQLKRALEQSGSGWLLSHSLPVVRGREQGKLLVYHREHYP